MTSKPMTASLPLSERKPRSQAGVLTVVSAIAACLVGLGWWSTRDRSEGKNTPEFNWVVAETRMLSTSVSATGTVKLKTGAEVRVGAQLSGIVRRLNVTVGSHIQKGDVIAEIDSRPVLAKIDVAKSQLAQSGVALRKAQTDFSRSEKLYKAGLIPQQQFDDAYASLSAAQATVAASESSLETAKVDLAYVQIHAPISGTVASVSTQNGETVAASFATPTFVTIIQEKALEVIAMVDEADIGNVRVGEGVTFTTETYADHEFMGKVSRIAPVATIISGVVNYDVAIAISNDIQMLRPDLTTNVTIRTSEHKAMLIPAKCVHREGGQTFIYVESPAGSAEKRAVTAAKRFGDEIEVVQGLQPGEKVRIEVGGPS